MPVLTNRSRVFISYSHYDRQWLDRFHVHLKPLQRDGVVDSWDDTRICAGQQWEAEIRDALIAAKAAVLLISADFLASDFIAGEELPRLLEAEAKSGLLILPVIIKPCRFSKTESLSRFHPVNRELKPLADMSESEQEALWEDVVSRLEAALSPTHRAAISPPVKHAWNIPFEHNSFFTGRQRILGQIRKALLATGRAALCGLGGIGKTQTAIEYARRHRGDYGIVLWANADSETSLVTSFVEIARVLDLPEAKEADHACAVHAAKRWLDINSGWLLILDNADRPALVKPFRPHNSEGHVLITSRMQALLPLGVQLPIELDMMEPDEAASFLMLRTGRTPDEVPEYEAATMLSKFLGGLPLALEQAGAYVAANNCLFADYLRSYRKRSLGVLHPPVAGEYPESVATTWAINFAEVEQRPASADLLRFSAFTSADNIPLELLIEGASHLGPLLRTSLSQVADDPLVLDETLEPLTRYSLICRDVKNRMYSIHRIMQAVLLDGMDESVKETWVLRLAMSLNATFPFPDYNNWDLCERLLPHAQAASLLVSKHSVMSLEAARLFVHAGLYLKQRAQFVEAEQLQVIALNLREILLGPTHAEVAQCLFNLAAINYYQGKPADAQPLAERVLSIQERQLEPDNPDLATTVNFLGILASSQGNWSQSAPFYERAIGIWTRALGDTHPYVAKGLNNLAEYFDHVGNYSEAERLCLASLEIRTKRLGAEHPDVARTLNNLATIYMHQGKTLDAEETYLRALAIRRNALGLSHPDVAETLEGYAILLRTQGRTSEANKMAEQALTIRDH